MDLFCWFRNVSSDDWELLLHFVRIFIPLVTLFLWIKGSSFTDLFDRITTAISTVLFAFLNFWRGILRRESISDSNGTKFHVTSRVDFPRGQKISRRWLVSWKPVPENNSQDSSKSAGTSSGESLNGGTKIVYFDPTTGMTFNVNTSIQSIGGETTPENEDDVRKGSPYETDKTK